jgi:glycosyltransferase involved in cell wall biosynthesis
MRLVEVVEVSLAPRDERWVGYSIDAPKQGVYADSRLLDIMGWVLAKEGSAVAVEIVHGGRVCRRTSVNIRRVDVGSAYPNIAEAEMSGFSVSVNAVGMWEAEFEVQAVLDDRSRVSLGVIRTQCRWRRPFDGWENPLVSIIIPCYNQAHFVSEAIESALAQTHSPIEIVVVDDGSADNTSAIAARYPGVRYVRQENKGLAGARNTGIRQSTGDFLVFLDADDRLMPRAVQAGLDSLRAHPECAFVSGHHRVIASDGSLLWEWKDHSLAHPLDRDPYEALLRQNYIPTVGTVLFRRPVFEAVGVFDGSWDAAADYDFYLRVARSFPILCHHEQVLEYRRHGGNMTHNAGVMLTQALRVLRAKRKVVRRQPQLRKAWRAGLRFYRSHFGGQLMGELKANIGDREWSRAIRNALVLLRHHPRGLLAFGRSKNA